MDQAVRRQLGSDPIYSGADAMVCLRQEPDERDQEVGRVKLGRTETLNEGAGVGVYPVLLNRLPDLMADPHPAIEIGLQVKGPGQPDRPLESYPPEHLRDDEVSTRVTELPERLVWFCPATGHHFNRGPQEVPELGIDMTTVSVVEPGCVDKLSVDIKLKLFHCRIADPHGPGAAIAVQHRQFAFLKQPLAGDAVENPEIVRAACSRALDPIHEVVRLVCIAEAEECVQVEGRIPKPDIAVVPVPHPAGPLRERGGR